MLSIIIPVYNQWSYTKSILTQISLLTSGEYEIIVIDSASTDETPFEIQNFPEVRYIKPTTNLFVNGAWNLGVQEAKGEYICIMNNDIDLSMNWNVQLRENLKDNILITSPIYTTGDTPFNGRWYRNNPSAWFNICGHCFVMKKKDWTPIPEWIKIWYGDNRQYEHIVRNKGVEMPIVGSRIHHYESKTVRIKNSMIESVIDQDKRNRKLYAEPYFKKLRYANNATIPVQG